MGSRHTQRHPRAPLRFDADLDQESLRLFQASAIEHPAMRRAGNSGKIAFHINWIYAFCNFVSLLFHGLDLMRYLISESSLEGEA